METWSSTLEFYYEFILHILKLKRKVTTYGPTFLPTYMTSISCVYLMIITVVALSSRRVWRQRKFPSKLGNLLEMKIRSYLKPRNSDNFAAHPPHPPHPTARQTEHPALHTIVKTTSSVCLIKTFPPYLYPSLWRIFAIPKDSAPTCRFCYL